MTVRAQLRQLAVKIDHAGFSAEMLANAWVTPTAAADAAVFRRWCAEMTKEFDELLIAIEDSPICAREWSEELRVALDQIRRALPFISIQATDKNRKDLPMIREVGEHGRVLRRLAVRVPHIPLPLSQHGEMSFAGPHAHVDSWVQAVSGIVERVGVPRAPSIVLGPPGSEPLVCGLRKPPLGRAQYAVIAALIDAGSEGLSKDKLTQRSNRGDAVNVFKRLSDKDDDWRAVLPRPKIHGAGYRVIGGCLEPKRVGTGSEREKARGLAPACRSGDT